MKNTLILVLGVALAGCSSDAPTDTANTPATPIASLAARTNPDPRVATIRQQHELLLAKQKEYIVQLGQLKGHEKLSPAHIKESEAYFADYVRQSQANLTALDLLDASMAHDPAQIALIGELAAKQTSLLARAEKRLAGIHNEHYLSK